MNASTLVESSKGDAKADPIVVARSVNKTYDTGKIKVEAVKASMRLN